MPNRIHVASFLILAVGIWAAILALRGASIGWEYIWPFGTVLTVLSLVLLAWDRAVWRFRHLHGWFVQRPDLRGTWRVRLVSDWVDLDTGQPTAPIDGFVAVTQSFSSLQLHVMTEESESWLLANQITKSPKGSGYQVVGVYMNQPAAALRGVRSEIHFGGLVLNTHGDAQHPDSMAGEYWTDRGTKGSMHLSDRLDEVHTQFTTAAKAMSKTL